MPRFVLGTEHSGLRLDKALALLMPETSRATLQRWIEEGRVSVDGKIPRSRDRARPGAIVDVNPGPPPPSEASPDPTVQFRALHEDPHLIVVEKPAGLVVHPARGHWTGTLVGGLLAREGFRRPPSDPLDPEGLLRPGIVHRIDKDTSGVLVVAKDEPTREGLKTQLARHTVEREYVALTLGTPRSGRIETFYARNPRSRLRFTSRVSEGRRAVTHLFSIEPLASRRAAIVRCRLETGRTHQIRVHLSEQARTPILADKIYGRRPGDDDLAEIADALGRQALHAAVLGFVHPITNEKLRFESPLPDDFAGALAALRKLGS